MPVSVLVSSAEATRELGRRLAGLLRAGDVVILAGELGAGKTTFVQGIGAGLGVRGAVTSPTFVISRVHPGTAGGLALVHVDAYRLGGEAELDDLDIDAFTDQAVTVVEWGDGLAETLSTHRLRVHLSRDAADLGPRRDPLPAARAGTRDSSATELGVADERRRVTVTPTGSRWIGIPLRTTLEHSGMRLPGGGRVGIGC